MPEIQGNAGIVKIFYRMLRVEQVVKGDFDPFPRVCPKDQRLWLIVPAQRPVNIRKRHEQKPIGVVIAVSVIGDILLDGGNFVFPDNSILAGAGRQRQYAVFPFA